MNYYIAEEATGLGGSFIISAKASRIRGQPYNKETPSQQAELRARANTTTDQLEKADILAIRIFHTDTGVDIITLGAITFGTTDEEHFISLLSFTPRLAPWPITLELRKRDGTTFRATTELSLLPMPSRLQSCSRIDSLRNALLIRYPNIPLWVPLFPNSFYLSGAWLASDPDNLQKLATRFNVLHIVPSGDGIGYDLDQLDAWFDAAERFGMWIMLDMRWTYQNRHYVRTQVERYKRRGNMLLWYTADEPDGHEDPPDAPSKAYAYIKSLDPYHPISLCLNCQNYHFQEYSAGADIILADVYPIGINTEYSNKYHTPCNTTYGDCGCDNCHTSPLSPALSNMPSRLDLWSRFQTQLGLPPKPLWSVPQAFTAQDFWTRTPTGPEVVAQALLAVNHGATGILMWLYPTSADIEHWTREFALLTLGTIFDRMVLREERQAVEVVRGPGPGRVDAAAWRMKDEVLVSVVALWEAETEKMEVSLRLPRGMPRAKAVDRIMWPRFVRDITWKLDDDGEGRAVYQKTMQGTESSVFVVRV
ncbi:MAG: hypothetical protein LQ348_004109 [Seirophora lacunosa]|nr:MAG: hypothetical protein LQ344_005829 [Seirophora lacunosa]KAI4187326.1 MAG: hypothetical protein LQ348_004109 [Seirophora lacunosa]